MNNVLHNIGGNVVFQLHNPLPLPVFRMRRRMRFAKNLNHFCL